MPAGSLAGTSPAPEEAIRPRYRTRAGLAPAAVALVAMLLASPARADLRNDLEEKKQRLASLQAELDARTADWQRAEQELFDLRTEREATEDRIAELRKRVGRTEVRFEDRAREAFMFGADGGAIGAFLDSQDLGELTDRIEFASTVAQGDRDLATDLGVTVDELGRDEERLKELVSEQATKEASLQDRVGELEGAVHDIAAEVDDLRKELSEQQQQQVGLGPVGGPFPTGGSGAIQICPVQGPVSFVDSFGWPRPGGRVHEGIDMISPFGTPVVAVHSGVAERHPNDLGGLAVVLYHDGSSDWTYYAHFSSYGAEGHVSAGTVIGYVGATGDTSTNHLHFEYHPGGGAAVDPYGALLAVC